MRLLWGVCGQLRIPRAWDDGLSEHEADGEIGISFVGVPEDDASRFDDERGVQYGFWGESSPLLAGVVDLSQTRCVSSHSPLSLFPVILSPSRVFVLRPLQTTNL